MALELGQRAELSLYPGGRAEPPAPGGFGGVGNFRERPLCLFRSRSTPAAGSPAPRLTPAVAPAARDRNLIIAGVLSNSAGDAGVHSDTLEQRRPFGPSASRWSGVRSQHP